MEAIGFERRLERFPWISYNSLVTITFFIPYALGKVAATVVVQHLGVWRKFEMWIAVASCVQILVVFLIPESPRWLIAQVSIPFLNIVTMIIKTETRADCLRRRRC